MAEWKAEWSGGFPNLCSGTWTLYKDGEEMATKIPFQHDEAGTYGEHWRWSFGPDWSEEWESYKDGANPDEWCHEHAGWLATLAPESEWNAIYEAFKEEDWRHGECGGCI